MATLPHVDNESNGSSNSSAKKKQRKSKTSSTKQETMQNGPGQVIRFRRKSLVESPLDLDSLVDCWPEWSAYLAKRPLPKRIVERFGAGKHPCLVWGTKSVALHPETIAIIRACDGAIQRQRVSTRLGKMVERWYAASSTETTGIDRGLGLLAIVQVLPELAGKISESLWLSLAEAVESEIRQGADFDVVQSPTERWLRTIELPLLWAYQFPEFAGHAARLRNVKRELAQALDDYVDGDGSVQVPNLRWVPIWLAIWTRSLLLAESLGNKPLTKDARLRFEWFVRNTLRWLRPDRSLLLSDSVVAEISCERRLLEAALLASHDKEDLKIAAFGYDLGNAKRVVNASSLPESAAHGEWAETAVLRSSWHPNDAMLAVDYSSAAMRVELFRYQSLLQGTTRHDLIVDGIPLPNTGDWVEVCWHEDDDAIYLELQKSFGDRVVVQRQWLMARQDRFCYFADAVLSKDDVEVDYRVEFPLDSSVMAVAAERSREVSLATGRRQWRVFPLAAPEWRREKSEVELEVDQDRLILTLQGKGQRHYLPIWIDLEPRRFKRSFTWRRLTIARDRVIEDARQAVGFRVQSGDEQWLFFRALAPRAPRTVLGEHLNCEFYAGKFRNDMPMDEIIRVEAADD